MTEKNISKDKLREDILDEVTQAYNEFIFYARKLDKKLPLDAIEEAILNGVISSQEIANHFKASVDAAVEGLRKRLRPALVQVVSLEPFGVYIPDWGLEAQRDLPSALSRDLQPNSNDGINLADKSKRLHAFILPDSIKQSFNVPKLFSWYTCLIPTSARSAADLKFYQVQSHGNVLINSA